MFSQMQRAEKWHCIAKEEIEKGKHLTLEALQEHQEEQVKDMIKERAILAIK